MKKWAKKQTFFFPFLLRKITLLLIVFVIIECDYDGYTIVGGAYKFMICHQIRLNFDHPCLNLKFNAVTCIYGY